MASSPLMTFFLLFVFVFLSFSPSISGETETHLHFFFHDLVTSISPGPTAIRVAQPSLTSLSLTGFGAVVMTDDALTETSNPNSKLVGRAQGFYAMASQEEAALLMAMNFAFVDGDYNGSTLAILGRNAVFSGVREMPVVGGSGKFRLARGYALAKTNYLNVLTGNAIVEYDVHVLHQ